MTNVYFICAETTQYIACDWQHGSTNGIRVGGAISLVNQWQIIFI